MSDVLGYFVVLLAEKMLLGKVFEPNKLFVITRITDLCMIFPWILHVCTIGLSGLALACWSFAETHFLLKTLQNLEAGADVKENLKNWAKQQEAELAEERSVSFWMSQGGDDVSGGCSYKMPWLCFPLLHVPVDVFWCTYIYIYI